MAKIIRLRVLTNQGLAVSDETVSIRVPGGLGSMGILYNHAPLVTTLTPGKLVWRRPDGTTRELEIGEGLMEVAHNRCTILTNTLRELGVAAQ